MERIEVPTAGCDALMRIIEYFDQQMERYIVGQEGSASATSSSGHSNHASAEFMASTKQQITKQDAAWLGCSLTGTDNEPSLVNTMLKYTYPEADFPVWWKFDVESTESQERVTGIKTLVDMGIKVKAQDARDAVGVSKPADGEEVIQPPQQPGAPGAAPPGGGRQGGGDNPPAALMGGGEGRRSLMLRGRPTMLRRRGALLLLTLPRTPGSRVISLMRYGTCGRNTSGNAMGFMQSRLAQLGSVLQIFGTARAAGGVDVGGKHYTGGEFIPAEVVAGATEEERSKLGKPGNRDSSIAQRSRRRPGAV